MSGHDPKGFPPSMGALGCMGPEGYDAAFEGRTATDLPFWKRRCEEARARGSGRILEIACGTGRLTVPLAQSGFSIEGLDLMPPMLEGARRRAEELGVSIPLHQGDCRTFRLHGRYSMVFMPFNSMLHLHTNDDLLSFWERVRLHLEPEGRFLFDIFNPNVQMLAREPGREHPCLEYPDPEDPTGETKIAVSEMPGWDVATQQVRQRWIFRRRGEVVAEGGLTLRALFPRELAALLRLGGFQVLRKWGDFDEQPYTSASPLQIVECAAHR